MTRMTRAAARSAGKAGATASPVSKAGTTAIVDPPVPDTSVIVGHDIPASAYERDYDDVPGAPVDDDAPVFFFGDKNVYGAFSQWHRSTFCVRKATIAGVCRVDVDTAAIEGDDVIAFGCAEQFMMFCKAVRFGDAAIQRELLVTPEPAAQKVLGRRVANFDDGAWDEVKSAVVACGSVHKFGQSDKLTRLLLGTDHKLLVEAAPRDRVWGIGYGAANALRRRETWGENRLGWALMQARAILRGDHERT